MAAGSNIEWTDASWQVTSGCTKVSPGCKNCYAETMANRLSAMAESDIANGRKSIGKEPYMQVIQDGHWNNKVICLPANLEIPLHWKKPRKVFVDSMSDLFHKDVPFDFIDKVFAVMALCPQHTFQVLTKRPDRMAEYLRGDCELRILKALAEFVGKEAPYQGEGRTAWMRKSEKFLPLPNVWLGTSIENMNVARDRLAALASCPAVIRFVSAEPLLEEVDFIGVWRRIVLDASRKQQICPPPHECTREVATATIRHAFNWIIVGGESGPGARPCDVAWIRSIVNQCDAAGVSCFVKQLGANIQDTNTTSAANFPDEQCWPKNTNTDYHRVLLKDKKGGNPDEWPTDLCVREMPVAEVGK